MYLIPAPPKRPPSPFLQFCNQVRLRSNLQHQSNQDLIKLMSQEWRSLSPDA